MVQMLPPSPCPCGLNVPGKKFGELNGTRMEERWLPKEIHIYSNFSDSFVSVRIGKTDLLQLRFQCKPDFFSSVYFSGAYPQIDNILKIFSTGHCE